MKHPNKTSTKKPRGSKKAPHPEPDPKNRSLEGKSRADEFREGREPYESIVRAFDGFICMVSEDYRVEFMDESYIQHIGHDARGERCYQALHQRRTICPWCVHDQVQRGETVRFEMQNPSDGRWYFFVNTPVYHPGGSISQMTTIHDITDRKSIEQELEHSRNELEQMVLEQTAALSKSNELLRQEIAERERIESSLRMSEEKYKELAELSHQIAYEIDRKGHFVFVNYTGLQALGYTWDELSVRFNVLDAVIPEDRERLAQNMSRVAQGEQLWSNEYSLKRKDGSVFPVLMYCSPIMRNNSVVGIRGVAIDITELRRAQEKLWIKNSAMACSMSAIAIVDLTGNVTYVNPAFLNLWGYHRSREVLSKKLDLFWKEKEKIQQVVAGLHDNARWLGELVARRNDGTTFDAQLVGTLVTDQSGKPICIMCSVLDVTDRKRAEEALRTSEERFRAVFEGARDCIFVKDRTLRYTLVNPAMEKLLGLPASEIVGRKAGDIFGADAGKRIRDVDLRALAGQSIEEEHTKIVRGEQLTFHDITVPLRNAQGAIIGICTISRNITERRKSQPVPQMEAQDYPSTAMRATLEKARHAADKDGIVLLWGQSGSGKDYLARWIHQHSRRANGPFFAINCAAVPHDLAESELFGHEAGAFTGARGRKRGLLELAEGGTLLLNEIGELSLLLQSKLLAFLDERSFLRVGGEKPVHVNARLMAATHRDLESEVTEGGFLPALFYRLNVFSIHVPSLRSRTEDIPMLVKEMLFALATEMQLSEVPVIDSHTIAELQCYPWPGNVRELRNMLERALMLWDRGDFRVTIQGMVKPGDNDRGKTALPMDRSLNEITDEMTRSLCVEALRKCRGNRKEAARMLGISRNSLYRYMKRFGLALENGTPVLKKVLQHGTRSLP